MSSHDLAHWLLSKPDLPIIIIPDGIYIKTVKIGQHLVCPDEHRETGDVVVIDTSFGDN